MFTCSFAAVGTLGTLEGSASCAFVRSDIKFEERLLPLIVACLFLGFAEVVDLPKYKIRIN